MSMVYPVPELTTDTRAWWQRVGLVPTAFTFIRLALCWVPMWMILQSPTATDKNWVWLTCIVLVALLLTDWIDGQLARRLNSVTDFGKMIDPLADKLILLGVFYALVQVGVLAAPWGWIYLWLNIVREVGMIVLRPVAKVVIPANRNGKLKFFLQAVGCGCAVLALLQPLWLYLAWPLLVVAMWYSIISAKDYVQIALRTRHEARR
jgi:CDP-diacylglycerol--glycerol-3-phosphate 3-phosphatidyltransferase